MWKPAAHQEPRQKQRKRTSPRHGGRLRGRSYFSGEAWVKYMENKDCRQIKIIEMWDYAPLSQAEEKQEDPEKRENSEKQENSKQQEDPEKQESSKQQEDPEKRENSKRQEDPEKSGNETLSPAEIERRSFEILTSEMAALGWKSSGDTLADAVLKRVVHTTADFSYLDNLVFTENACARIAAALREGAVIVTDTEMARAGINKRKLREHGGDVYCFMSDPAVAAEAQARGVTRACVSMEHAAALFSDCIAARHSGHTAAQYSVLSADRHGSTTEAGELSSIGIPESCEEQSSKCGRASLGEVHIHDGSHAPENPSLREEMPRPVIFVIGNAPTALFSIENLVRQGRLRPAGIIAVPVGFVHVVEAKERILKLAKEGWIPGRQSVESRIPDLSGRQSVESRIPDLSGQQSVENRLPDLPEQHPAAIRNQCWQIPCIAARGRKGGSNVAAAIVNALLYSL